MEEYNNISVLKLNVSKDIKDFKVKITLPEDTTFFKPQAKKTVSTQINGYSYEVDLSKINVPKNKIVEIGMDSIVPNIPKVNSTYRLKEGYGFFDNENMFTIKVLICISVVDIFLLIITLLLTKKIKVEKNYLRETEEVIEPVMAEAIIDRKIGTQELIMSCVVDLITRGI